MTKPTNTAEVTKPFIPVAPPTDTAVKLFLPLGRGARGKTLLSRWVVEEAQEAGRMPVVADADRTNQTLARFFEGVLSPNTADEADVTNFIAGLIEAQATQRFDLVLDLGGGDLILKRLAREMDLGAWLPSLGIEPVVAHLLGPSADDLSYLQSVEDGGLLAPPATLLVLNEVAAPPGRTAHTAFAATIEAHPILTATVARGAQIVAMPRLEPACEIETRGMSFLQAAENRAPAGRQPLGLWKSQQASLWRRRMAVAFTSVRSWLP